MGSVAGRSRFSETRFRTLIPFLRKEPPQEMAFPHPQSRKGEDWKEDKPNRGDVVWDLFEGAINVTDYRNAKDEVNRTKNRTFGALANHLIPFR